MKIKDSKTSLTRSTVMGLIVALLWPLFAGVASAQTGSLSVAKLTDRTSASITGGELITFRIQYQYTSTTAAGQNVTLTDILDPNLELVAITGSAHTVSESYDPGTRTILFSYQNPLPSGTSGDVLVQAKFISTTPHLTVATNEATISATNAAAVSSNSVSVTGTVSTSSGPIFIDGIYISKWDNGELVLPAGRLEYRIDHGNDGGVGQDIPDYTIQDIFPAGFKLDWMYTGEFGSTSQPIDIHYRTNLNAAWTPWPGNPRANTSTGSYIYAAELGLPLTEWVTGLRFFYGTLIGGGSFHHDNHSSMAINVVGDGTGTLVAGDTVENCADGTGGSYAQQSCAEEEVQPSQAAFYLWDWPDSGYGRKAPGSTFRMAVAIGVQDISSTDLEDPNFAFLVPEHMTYAGNEICSGGGWTEMGSPAPSISVIENFNGTGQQLVRFAWPGSIIPGDGDHDAIYAYFDLQIATNAPYGSYLTNVYGGWQSPEGEGFYNMIVDTADYDGDGEITENIAHDVEWIEVGVEPGLPASINATKWVRGELDAEYSKFPDAALTVPGGRADYKLIVENVGAIQMKNIILIDILPHLGDKGVVDLSSRNSDWKPFLAGAVTAPSGITVYYSLSGNPCRDELTPGLPAGCDDPVWSTSLPADITTVNSLKFEFGSRPLFPGEKVTIEWPMRASISAPTSGEVAWNSFGYVATRSDNDSKGLASEPIKVGIALDPPIPGFFGDLVWEDADGDGVQSPSEEGINGIRVELYQDNGDSIQDPNTDTLFGFTVTANNGVSDGWYLFSGLPTGQFYGLVVPSSKYTLSPANVGGDDSDSDGTPSEMNGILNALMPMTTINSTDTQRHWDQGLIDRAGLPAVWVVKEAGSGLLIGGSFTSSHGIARNNIALLDGNGGVDVSFDPGNGFDGPVHSLNILSGGRILAGGPFTHYNGQPAYGVAILEADGTFVSSPAPPNSVEVKWVGIAPTGKIAYAGSFNAIDGQNQVGIAFLNPNDGSVDSSFNSGLAPGASVHTVAFQEDGKILIGGNFTSYGGVARNNFARLNLNGSLDPTLDPGSGTNGSVQSLYVRKDGDLVLGGEFTSYNGSAASGVVRIDTTGASIANRDFSPEELTVSEVSDSD